MKKKYENILGIYLIISLLIFFTLICFGDNIEFLNKGKIVTDGIGNGVFYSLSDLLTYTVFIIGCTISVIYLSTIILLKNVK